MNINIAYYVFFKELDEVSVGVYASVAVLDRFEPGVWPVLLWYLTGLGKKRDFWRGANDMELDLKLVAVVLALLMLLI